MAIKEGPSHTGLLDKKMITGYKAICKKHGDITNAAYYFDYKIVNHETGKEEVYKSIYCIPCINEYLMSLQKEGKIPEIALVAMEASDEKKEDTEDKEEK